MKKHILAISLSLLIPFSLISCSSSAEAQNKEENKVSNSTAINNDSTSSKENNSSSSETTTEKNTEEDTEKEEMAKIYFYDVISDKIVYINTNIKVNGDASNALVEELKKSPDTEISPSLASDISLNSTNLNNENSTITLDFSSNFISSQNLGSGAESRNITAICNTFGSYYNVENVIITLDGKPYSSGHILMNPGEAFKVNLEDTVELK